MGKREMDILLSIGQDCVRTGDLRTPIRYSSISHFQLPISPIISAAQIA